MGAMEPRHRQADAGPLSVRMGDERGGANRSSMPPASFANRVPPAGFDPSGYLEVTLKVIRDRKIDVLMPVHEQAYLFAARRQLIPSNVGLALASFHSFEQVQSKDRFTALLSRLCIPQPQTDMCNVTDLNELNKSYPFFVKTPFGTAGEGVWRIKDASDMRDLVKGHQASCRSIRNRG